MTRKDSLILRFISACLVVFFFLQDISYAAPLDTLGIGTVRELPLQIIAQDPTCFEAPLGFVTTKEVYKGTNGMFIIHIQDAHSNLSGQQNLAGALDEIMSRYHVSLILSEGGANDCSLTPLKKIASADIWKKIAKSYLMQGKISGEEYLNLVSDHPMKIMGIEDLGLYLTSVDNYGKLAGKREEILDYLKSIHRVLDKLKNKLYPKELLEYEKIVDSRLDAGRNFEASFKKLSELSGTSLLPRSPSFPNLSKLKTLQTKEKEINFEAANLEQSVLVEEIFRQGGKEDLESHLKKMNEMKDQKVSQLAYFQNTLNIAKDKKIDTQKFTNLLLYLDYLKASSEIDLDQLLDEMMKAEDRVYLNVIENNVGAGLPRPDAVRGNRAPTGDNVKDALLIRAIDRYVALLDTAYHIQMTTKEFNLFKVNEPDFATIPYLAFLNRKLAEQGYFEDLIPYKNLLEEGKEALEEFYNSVDKRDVTFVQNAEKILKSENQKVAVLITGGYHTPHLKNLFKEKGYSYVVLTPIVTSATNQQKYEKRLLGPIQKETKKLEITQGESKSGDVSLGRLGSEFKLKKKSDGVKAALVAMINPNLVDDMKVKNMTIEQKERLRSGYELLDYDRKLILDIVQQVAGEKGLSLDDTEKLRKQALNIFDERDKAVIPPKAKPSGSLPAGQERIKTTPAMTTPVVVTTPGVRLASTLWQGAPDEAEDRFISAAQMRDNRPDKDLLGLLDANFELAGGGARKLMLEALVPDEETKTFARSLFLSDIDGHFSGSPKEFEELKNYVKKQLKIDLRLIPPELFAAFRKNSVDLSFNGLTVLKVNNGYLITGPKGVFDDIANRRIHLVIPTDYWQIVDQKKPESQATDIGLLLSRVAPFMVLFSHAQFTTDKASQAFMDTAYDHWRHLGDKEKSEVASQVITSISRRVPDLNRKDMKGFLPEDFYEAVIKAPISASSQPVNDYGINLSKPSEEGISLEKKSPTSGARLSIPTPESKKAAPLVRRFVIYTAAVGALTALTIVGFPVLSAVLGLTGAAVVYVTEKNFFSVQPSTQFKGSLGIFEPGPLTLRNTRPFDSRELASRSKRAIGSPESVIGDFQRYLVDIIKEKHAQFVIVDGDSKAGKTTLIDEASSSLDNKYKYAVFHLDNYGVIAPGLEKSNEYTRLAEDIIKAIDEHKIIILEGFKAFDWIAKISGLEAGSNNPNIWQKLEPILSNSRLTVRIAPNTRQLAQFVASRKYLDTYPDKYIDLLVENGPQLINIYEKVNANISGARLAIKAPASLGPTSSVGARLSGLTRRQILAAGILSSIGFGAVALSLLSRRSNTVPEVSVEILSVQIIDHILDVINVRLKPGEAYRIFKIKNLDIYYIEFGAIKIQTNAFGRLNIFVESENRNGVVVDDKELLKTNPDFAGHDYGIGDVARFYTQANAQNIPLSQIERQLKKDLLNVGLIKETPGGQFEAMVQAAVISSAQDLDTKYYKGARSQIIAHEWRHGLYFVKFKEQINQVWNEMLTKEKQMIADILYEHGGYNRNDPSLMAREFHAYVMEVEAFSKLLDNVRTKGREQATRVEALRSKLLSIRSRFLEIEKEYAFKNPGARLASLGEKADAILADFDPKKGREFLRDVAADLLVLLAVKRQTGATFSKAEVRRRSADKNFVQAIARAVKKALAPKMQPPQPIPPPQTRQEPYVFKTAVELHGNNLAAKMNGGQIGELASVVAPDAGYRRILTDQHLEEIAGLVQSKGIGFVFSHISFTRTKIDLNRHPAILVRFLLAYQQEPGRKSVRSEIVIPDFLEKQIVPSQIEKLVNLYPANLAGLFQSAPQLRILPPAEKEPLMALAAQLTARPLPVPSLEVLEKTMRSAVLHEIGETLWIILETKASSDADPVSQQAALELFNLWRLNFYTNTQSLSLLKNSMKEKIDPNDRLIVNGFADRFAMYLDPHSVFRDFGETMGEEEIRFFERVVQFFQNEQSKDANALFVRTAGARLAAKVGSRLPFSKIRISETEIDLSSPDRLLKSLQSNPQALAYNMQKFVAESAKVNRENGKSAVADDTKRLPTVYIGDLHGRMDVLWAILNDEVKVEGVKIKIIDALLQRKIKLRQVGDVTHPTRTKDMTDPEAHLRSFLLYTFFLILKNEVPEHLELTIGNHENGVIGGKKPARPVGEILVDLDEEFKKAVMGIEWTPITLTDGSTLQGSDAGKYLYQQFVGTAASLAVAIRDQAADANIGVVHAGPPTLGQLKSLQDLKDIVHANPARDKSNKSYTEMLWTRKSLYNPEEAWANLAAFSSPEIMNIGLLISGHIAPDNFETNANLSVQVLKEGDTSLFAVLEGVRKDGRRVRQIIIDASQGNKIGYLFIDATKPIPDDITNFGGTAGSAFRVLDIDLNNQKTSRDLSIDQAALQAYRTQRQKIEEAQETQRKLELERDKVRQSFPAKMAPSMQSDDMLKMARAYRHLGMSVPKDKTAFESVEYKTFIISRVFAALKKILKKNLPDPKNEMLSTIENHLELYYLIADYGLSEDAINQISRVVPAGLQQEIRTKALARNDQLAQEFLPKAVSEKAQPSASQYQDFPSEVRDTVTGHILVKKFMVLNASDIPTGQALVNEVSEFIGKEKDLMTPDQKVWADANAKNPRLLPYMEAARRSNILLIVNREIESVAAFETKFKPYLDMLIEIFDEIPKELMWDVANPMPWAADQTSKNLYGYQGLEMGGAGMTIFESPKRGGIIGKLFSAHGDTIIQYKKEELRETVIHELLGHKRHYSYRAYEVKDGKFRRPGLNKLSPVMSGMDWYALANVNGVRRLTVLTDEEAENLQKGETVAAAGIPIRYLANFGPREIIGKIHNIMRHPRLYFQDIRELAAYTAQDFDLQSTVDTASGDPLNESHRLRESQRVLMGSLFRVGIPVDLVNQVYISYIFNRQTTKFDSHYVRNIGTEQDPEWQEVTFENSKWKPISISKGSVPTARPVQIVSEGKDTIQIAGVKLKAIITSEKALAMTYEGSDQPIFIQPAIASEGLVYKLGRANDSHVQFFQRDVSRNHAEIRYRNGDFFLVSLPSRNGTFLNGVMMDELKEYPLIFGKPRNPQDESAGARLASNLKPKIPAQSEKLAQVPKGARLAVTNANTLHPDFEGFPKAIDTDYHISYLPFITSNEFEHEKVIKQLESLGVNDGIHIGFSGLYNLDIIAARKSSLGLIFDINSSVPSLLRLVNEVILESKDRQDFKNKFLDKLAQNVLPVGEISDRLDILKKQFDKPESWLYSDEKFLHIQKMFSEGRILYLRLDATDSAKFQAIGDWIQKKEKKVDTIYISNVYEWVSGEGVTKEAPIVKNPAEQRAKFLASVGSIAGPETQLIFSKVHDRGLTVQIAPESAQNWIKNEKKALQAGARLAVEGEAARQMFRSLFGTAADETTLFLAGVQTDSLEHLEQIQEYIFKGDRSGLRRLTHGYRATFAGVPVAVEFFEKRFEVQEGNSKQSLRTEADVTNQMASEGLGASALYIEVNGEPVLVQKRLEGEPLESEPVRGKPAQRIRVDEHVVAGFAFSLGRLHELGYTHNDLFQTLVDSNTQYQRHDLLKRDHVFVQKNDLMDSVPPIAFLDYGIAHSWPTGASFFETEKKYTLRALVNEYRQDYAPAGWEPAKVLETLYLLALEVPTPLPISRIQDIFDKKYKEGKAYQLQRNKAKSGARLANEIPIVNLTPDLYDRQPANEVIIYKPKSPDGWWIKRLNWSNLDLVRSEHVAEYVRLVTELRSKLESEKREMKRRGIKPFEIVEVQLVKIGKNDFEEDKPYAAQGEFAIKTRFVSGMSLSDILNQLYSKHTEEAQKEYKRLEEVFRQSLIWITQYTGGPEDGNYEKGGLADVHYERPGQPDDSSTQKNFQMPEKFIEDGQLRPTFYGQAIPVIIDPISFPRLQEQMAERAIRSKFSPSLNLNEQQKFIFTLFDSDHAELYPYLESYLLKTYNGSIPNDLEKILYAMGLLLTEHKSSGTTQILEFQIKDNTIIAREMGPYGESVVSETQINVTSEVIKNALSGIDLTNWNASKERNSRLLAIFLSGARLATSQEDQINEDRRVLFSRDKHFDNKDAMSQEVERLFEGLKFSWLKDIKEMPLTDKQNSVLTALETKYNQEFKKRKPFVNFYGEYDTLRGSSLEFLVKDLLRNAFDAYSRANRGDTRVEGAVSLRVKEDHDNFIIEISDSALGIRRTFDGEDGLLKLESNAVPAVVDESKSDLFGGFGVGLNLAKALTEIHHGSFEALSPGVGDFKTTFRMTLPKNEVSILLVSSSSVIGARLATKAVGSTKSERTTRLAETTIVANDMSHFQVGVGQKIQILLGNNTILATLTPKSQLLVEHIEENQIRPRWNGEAIAGISTIGKPEGVEVQVIRSPKKVSIIGGRANYLIPIINSNSDFEGRVVIELFKNKEGGFEIQVANWSEASSIQVEYNPSSQSIKKIVPRLASPSTNLPLRTRIRQINSIDELKLRDQFITIKSGTVRQITGIDRVKQTISGEVVKISGREIKNVQEFSVSFQDFKRELDSGKYEFKSSTLATPLGSFKNGARLADVRPEEVLEAIGKYATYGYFNYVDFLKDKNAIKGAAFQEKNEKYQRILQAINAGEIQISPVFGDFVFHRETKDAIVIIGDSGAGKSYLVSRLVGITDNLGKDPSSPWEYGGSDGLIAISYSNRHYIASEIGFPGQRLIWKKENRQDAVITKIRSVTQFDGNPVIAPIRKVLLLAPANQSPFDLDKDLNYRPGFPTRQIVKSWQRLGLIDEVPFSDEQRQEVFDQLKDRLNQPFGARLATKPGEPETAAKAPVAAARLAEKNVIPAKAEIGPIPAEKSAGMTRETVSTPNLSVSETESLLPSGSRLAKEEIDEKDLPVLQADESLGRLLAQAVRANPGLYKLGYLFNFFLPRIGKNTSLKFVRKTENDQVSYLAEIYHRDAIGFQFTKFGYIDYTSYYEQVTAIPTQSQAEILRAGVADIVSMKVQSVDHLALKLLLDALSQKTPAQLAKLEPLILTQYLLPSSDQASAAYNNQLLASKARIKAILKEKAALTENEAEKEQILRLISFRFYDNDGRLNPPLSDSVTDSKAHEMILSPPDLSRIQVNKGFLGITPLQTKKDEYNVMPVFATNIAAMMIVWDINPEGTHQLLQRLIGQSLPQGIEGSFRNVTNPKDKIYFKYIVQAIERLALDLYIKVAAMVQKAIGSAA